jgi:hypothetical protein
MSPQTYVHDPYVLDKRTAVPRRLMGGVQPRVAVRRIRHDRPLARGRRHPQARRRGQRTAANHHCRHPQPPAQQLKPKTPSSTTAIFEKKFFFSKILEINIII